MNLMCHLPQKIMLSNCLVCTNSSNAHTTEAYGWLYSTGMNIKMVTLFQSTGLTRVTALVRMRKQWESYNLSAHRLYLYTQ